VHSVAYIIGIVADPKLFLDSDPQIFFSDLDSDTDSAEYILGQTI
jgi:hypothetical protein